jgi:type VI secretion system protein ImpK
MTPSDNDDPFSAFESERTVIKPSAGRGARAGQPAAAQGAAPAGAGAGRDAPLALDALMTASLNPLVSAAGPLLNAAARIRAMPQHSNPAGLKDALADGIRKFEAQARTEGLPNEQVIAARYILCTLLDEAAADTPWGGSGVWSAHSLLVQFHNEAWGGEKVFQLMSKLAENVPNNRNLLELLYVALAFGFEGRYRVLDNGRAQLDSVRTRLAQMLQQGRTVEPGLSPRWQGVQAGEAKLGAGVPMWVVAAVLGLLLAAVYVPLRLMINNHSDPLFGALSGLDVKAAPAPPVALPPPAVPTPPRLATFLKPEIDAGLVQVRDAADRSVIIIKGDGFFEPARAEVAARVRPLMGRIQEALAAVQGQVLITGHTDNQPIRSARFPSNWHLSQERATAVKGLLAPQVAPERMRAEGRADSEPVEGNQTPAQRAQNRRVEITLFVQNKA